MAIGCSRVSTTAALPGVSTKPVSHSSTRISGLGALSREDLSVSELEDMVKSDVSLAFRVPRAVNSPALGLCREITSLRQALVLLGRERVRQVGLGLDAGRSLVESRRAAAHHRADPAATAGGCRQPGSRDRTRAASTSVRSLLKLLDAVLKQAECRRTRRRPASQDDPRRTPRHANQARLVLDAVIAYSRGDWTAPSN
ncbi:MAG: HDOD domain-containing protein [Vicinamibacterales bacterium]